MLHVDPLSGYFICGASSLVAAVMLRAAETTDEPTLRALRICGWGFVVLGVGLMPAGFGPPTGHAWREFMLAFGSLAGMLLAGQGLGQIHGRGLPVKALLVLLVVAAVGMVLSLQAGTRTFGMVYAVAFAAAGLLATWLVRGMVVRPRELTERAFGIAMAVLAVSCVARLIFTLTDDGPARNNMMYAPPPFDAVLAALYGVMPMIFATLLLNLVNGRLRAQLRTLAITDELTGAMTRRALRELAPGVLAQQRRKDGDVAVMMLDLDRFKAINDDFGHPMGDAVLRLVASTLHTHLRADGLLARYGGEEFVALMPVDGLPSARRIAERLRHAVESADWRALGIERGVTVSVGVAMVAPNEELDTAMQRADEALYRAKHGGRNQCQFGLAVA